MVGNPPRLAGASGKQPALPAITVTNSPMPLLPAKSPSSGHVDLMKTLVDTITMSNVMVKKLNSLKKEHCLDTSRSQVVLDDELETPIPDLGAFIAVPPTLIPSHTTSLLPVQLLQIPVPPSKATGTNSVSISPSLVDSNPLALPTISHIGW